MVVNGCCVLWGCVFVIRNYFFFLFNNLDLNNKLFDELNIFDLIIRLIVWLLKLLFYDVVIFLD